MKRLIIIAFLITLIPTIIFAAEALKHKDHEAKTGVEALSPDLRGVLSQEMNALESGMISIIPQYNSGNWAEIESTARKMKNSYILKQSLTEKQVKELHSGLSHAFIEKDQQFHYLAGMLEHAAKSKKPELVNFYFSKMNESCFSCHNKFATHKFPALKSNNAAEHAH
jgi:hypothetical protein